MLGFKVVRGGEGGSWIHPGDPFRPAPDARERLHGGGPVTSRRPPPRPGTVTRARCGGNTRLGRPRGGAGIRRQCQAGAVARPFFPSLKSTNRSDPQGDSPDAPPTPGLARGSARRRERTGDDRGIQAASPASSVASETQRGEAGASRTQMKEYRGSRTGGLLLPGPWTSALQPRRAWGGRSLAEGTERPRALPASGCVQCVRCEHRGIAGLRVSDRSQPFS